MNCAHAVAAGQDSLFMLDTTGLPLWNWTTPVTVKVAPIVLSTGLILFPSWHSFVALSPAPPAPDTLTPIDLFAIVGGGGFFLAIIIAVTCVCWRNRRGGYYRPVVDESFSAVGGGGEEEGEGHVSEVGAMLPGDSQ